MLFDLISAIEVAVCATIVAAVLTYSLSKSVEGRFRAAIVLAVWFAIVIVLGATQALDAGHIGAPGLGAAAALPIAALCIAFFAVRSPREAMLATPIAALVAVNALRVLLGLSLVLLYNSDRLSAPFAPAAGWGDIFVGATAGPLALIIHRYGARANALALVWNAIGFVDLIVAAGLGATSAPGPLQLFVAPPGSAIMIALPWIIITCFLVPSYQALHIAIFYRLSERARAGRRWSGVAAAIIAASG
jgi:uncharacterized membrane protein